MTANFDAQGPFDGSFEPDEPFGTGPRDPRVPGDKAGGGLPQGGPKNHKPDDKPDLESDDKRDDKPDDRADRADDPGQVFQPPDPTDLQRVPPQSSDCARVRGMLRDFADHELTEQQQAFVEDHAHSCRTCAVALARSEYEVFRLRNAFLGSWAAIGPRVGFAKRTVHRLLAETSTDRRLPTAGIMSAVASVLADEQREARQAAQAAKSRGRQAKAGKGGSQRRHRIERRLLAIVSGVGLMACVLAAGLIWQNNAELASLVRLSIRDARHAWRDAGSERHRIQAGDGLQDGAVLVVDPDGAAAVEWHDAKMTGKQPAASMTVSGDGELRLHDGLPQLMRGALRIESQREMSVLLADGSTIVLGAGDYHVSATEQSSAYDRLAADGTPLAVRVEVIEGEDATLTREGGGRVTIAAGRAARYRDAYSGIAVENMPTARPAGPGARTEQPIEREPEPEADLEGLVIDERGAGIAGALAGVQYAVGGGLSGRFDLATDALGRFRLANPAEDLGAFALVDIEPPASQRSLGFTVRDAVMLSGAETTHHLAPVVLRATQPMHGTVVDNHGDPLRDVRVVPCLYDEVLGGIYAYADRAQVSDVRGAFVLEGLPAELPQRMSLALILSHPQLQVGFQPIPLPGSAAANVGELRIEVVPTHAIEIEGLPAGSACDIYEEVSALPVSGRGIRVRQVWSSSSGRITGLPVGSGRLWLRSGSSTAPSLRAIVRGHHEDELVVAQEAVPHESVFAAKPGEMLQVSAGNGQSLLLAATLRHDSYRAPLPRATFQVVRTAGTNPLAQVFALTPLASGGQRARFLGISDGVSGFAMDFDAGENEVVAIADGMVARASTASMYEPHGRTLVVNANGTLHIDEATLPMTRSVMLRLEPSYPGAAGARPPLFRFVCHSAPSVSDIPAGGYTLHVDESGAGHPLHLSPGESITLP